jgi:phage/plasmid-like protein (TIGR03299 family)
MSRRETDDMAHNLANIDGRVAMAYQGETPWHKLGTRIDSGTSINEAIVAASLDWTVSLHDLRLPDGRTVSHKAILRDNDQTIIDVVSGAYQPIQNRDAFEVFGPAVEKFGLTIESAGALGRGERVWMLFRLPVDATPVPGDDVRGYGLAITGHNGTQAFEFRPTPIRVVCQNTLNAAAGDGRMRTSKGQVFSIMHLGNVKDQVEQAGRLVVRAMDAMKATGDTFATMARKQLTPVQVKDYIEAVFPAPADGTVSDTLAAKRAEVARLTWEGVGAELAMSETNGQPNAWAVYNAVTEYFDHVLTGKAKSEKSTTVANRSAVFGAGADVKLLALQRARQLVAA